MIDDPSTPQVPQDAAADDRLGAPDAPASSARGWSQIWDSLVRVGLGEVALRIGTGLASLALILLVVWIMGNLYLKGRTPAVQESAQAAPIPTPTATINVVLAELSNADPYANGVARYSQLHTILPTRPRFEILVYDVQKGDTLFTIAEKYNLRPQTMLWGNYDSLRDNPDNLRESQKINILPVDGVLYKWNAGDGLNSVAKFFGVKPDDIVNYPGNKLDAATVGDYSKPNIAVGTMLIVPGGKREFVSWSAPRVTRTTAASAKVLGPGNCGNITTGPVGSGTFIWPTGGTHNISNPFSLAISHPAIDLPGYIGSPIVAVDSGVVVYSGWNDWGFGNMIMIDHGNGWQSLYGHMSQLLVGCGASVTQGQKIGLMGSTGNSTGPHLHLELRNDVYGTVNPVLFLR